MTERATQPLPARVLSALASGHPNAHAELPHRNRVGRELRARIAAFEGGPDAEPLFPAAARFLRSLQVLCEAPQGLHLGGRKHAHVYFNGAFVLYLRLEGLTAGRPALVLSKQPHGQLKHGTVDASDLLFRRRIAEVIGTLGLERHPQLMATREGYRALPGVPVAFFQLLIAQLIDIVQAGDDAGAQPELFARSVTTRRRPRRAGAAPQTPPSPPATVALAEDVTRSLATLRDLLSARLGAPVTIDLNETGATLRWGEGERAGEVVGWTLAEAVAAL